MTPSSFTVVVHTKNGYRIITYLEKDYLVWEIQERGIIRFWRWFTVSRWKMEGDKAVVLPD